MSEGFIHQGGALKKVSFPGCYCVLKWAQIHLNEQMFSCESFKFDYIIVNYQFNKVLKYKININIFLNHNKGLFIFDDN